MAMRRATERWHLCAAALAVCGAGGTMAAPEATEEAPESMAFDELMSDVAGVGDRAVGLRVGGTVHRRSARWTAQLLIRDAAPRPVGPAFVVRALDARGVLFDTSGEDGEPCRVRPGQRQRDTVCRIVLDDLPLGVTPLQLELRSSGARGLLIRTETWWVMREPEQATPSWVPALGQILEGSDDRQVREASYAAAQRLGAAAAPLVPLLVDMLTPDSGDWSAIPPDDRELLGALDALAAVGTAAAAAGPRVASLLWPASFDEGRVTAVHLKALSTAARIGAPVALGPARELLLRLGAPTGPCPVRRDPGCESYTEPLSSGTGDDALDDPEGDGWVAARLLIAALTRESCTPGATIVHFGHVLVCQTDRMWRGMRVDDLGAEVVIDGTVRTQTSFGKVTLATLGDLDGDGQYSATLGLWELPLAPGRSPVRRAVRMRQGSWSVRRLPNFDVSRHWLVLRAKGDTVSIDLRQRCPRGIFAEPVDLELSSDFCRTRPRECADLGFD